MGSNREFGKCFNKFAHRWKHSGPSSLFCTAKKLSELVTPWHRRMIIQKRRQMSSLLFGKQTLLILLAALAILHQEDLKNRINSSFSFKSS